MLVDGREPQVQIVHSRSSGVAVKFVLSGHDSDHVSENLALRFPSSDGSVPHVGVLHAHVVDTKLSSQHKKYAPCTVADLASKEYSYWALGHIHLRQQVSDAVQALYPGNIQGRTPRESGAKGGVVVSVDANGVATTDFTKFAAFFTCFEHLNNSRRLCLSR